MTDLKSGSRFPTFRYLVSWRFLKRALFVFASFATLVALFYAEENVRGKHAWDSYVRAQAAKGEKIYLTEFIPPPVPDEQNLALCPLLKPILDWDFRPVTEGGTTRLVRGPNRWRDTNGVNRLWQLNRTASVLQYHDSQLQKQRTPAVVKRRELAHHLSISLEGHHLTNGWIDLAGWAAFYRTGTNLSGVDPTNSAAADVLLALRSLEPDLAQLQQEANRRPQARWPIYYNTNDPFDILLPHLAPLKSMNVLLQLRSAARLATGDSAGGLAEIELGLRLADTVREEPFLISHLVRLACYEIMWQPLKEGLARSQFSRAQLIEMEARLRTADLLEAYSHSIRGERSLESNWNRYLREGEFDWKKISERWEFQWDPYTWLFIMPSGWVYRNQLALFRLYDEFCLPAVDIPLRRVYPNRIQGLDSQTGERNGPFNVLLKLRRPQDGTPRKFAYGQTHVDEALIACALERYRLAKGSFPDDLSALARDFLELLPKDLLSGESLKYRRTDDGQYLLYSIGWNEKDDGGVDSRSAKGSLDLGRGDWVWQLPPRK